MSTDERKTDSMPVKPGNSGRNSRIKLSLFLNYFVFAILLNSVGTVILQMINQFGVSSTDASILTVFKELTIAIASFAVASFLPRLGYRTSMLIGLGLVTASAFLLLLFSPLDESAARQSDPDFRRDFLAMLRLVRAPLVGVFLVSAFLYVIIEQAIISWLPAFNNQILQLPADTSIQVASLLDGTLALGRFLGGWVMKKVRWIAVLVVSLAAAMLLVVLILPLSKGVVPGSVTGWRSLPPAAFIFPLIGLFLATIYPTLCSTILSRLPTSRHSAMTGLIVIFSALGGTLGSRLTGLVFGLLDGVTAFYCTLIPMTLLLLLLSPYEQLRQSFEYGHPVKIYR